MAAPNPAALVKVDSQGTPYLNLDALKRGLFGGQVPDSEDWRSYWGANLTPQQIEQALLAADAGHMRDLTDMSYETALLDLSMSGMLVKRFGALRSVEPEFEAASGAGVDPEMAAAIADTVRQQMTGVEQFPDRVEALAWGHYTGRACLEATWDEYPGAEPGLAWQLRDLSWIHPRRLSFNRDRELMIRDDAIAGGGWRVVSGRQFDTSNIWGGGGGFDAPGFPVNALAHKFVPFLPRLFNDYPEREGLASRLLYFAFMKRFAWRERMALIEIYGKPWRIVQAREGKNVDDEKIREALDTVDQLGGHQSTYLPAWAELNTDHPHPDSPEAHQSMIADCDSAMARLILGNERSTMSGPAGLGSSEAEVHQDAEHLILVNDGSRIAAALKRLARSIVALNWGESVARRYTPDVRIAFEPPPDHQAEIANAVSFMQGTGLGVKRSELYRRAGYEEPAEGDDVVTAPKAPAGALPPLFRAQRQP